MTTTRGFTGRRRGKADQQRVPPGQYVTDDFPVLSAGPTPRTPLDGRTLTLQDRGSLVGKWTWEQFQALAVERRRGAVSVCLSTLRLRPALPLHHPS